MKIRYDLKQQLCKQLSIMSPEDASKMIEIYYNTLDEVSKEFYKDWIYCAHCGKYVKNKPVLVPNGYGRYDACCPECKGVWKFEVLE